MKPLQTRDGSSGMLWRPTPSVIVTIKKPEKKPGFLQRIAALFKPDVKAMERRDEEWKALRPKATPITYGINEITAGAIVADKIKVGTVTELEKLASLASLGIHLNGDEPEAITAREVAMKNRERDLRRLAQEKANRQREAEIAHAEAERERNAQHYGGMDNFAAF